MAVTDRGDSSICPISFSTLLPLRPASTSTDVFPVAKNRQLPLLPLDNAQNFIVIKTPRIAFKPG
jgi:hypothetical protein